MRILQTNKFFFLNGGSEKYMFDLCELLEKKGHAVMHFSMQDDRNLYSADRAYFIKNIDYNNNSFHWAQKAYIALRTLYCYEAKGKIKQLIKKKRPHVAHIHNFNYHLTPSILEPLVRRKIPIIQTLHDYHIICPSHNLYDFRKLKICEDCQGKHFFRAVNRKCIKESSLKSLIGAMEGYWARFLGTYNDKINLFVSPSKFLRDKIVEFGIDPKKVCHIPNFINTIEIQPKFRSENYFVYFGRLEKFKGIWTLLQAFKKIKDSKLLILGSGQLSNAIRKFIQTQNVKNIELIGFKSKKELYPILANCIATITPSEWFENNPLSVLESFAFGKPVIGSDIGGLPEIIDDGNNGFLFDAGNHEELADKILNCLNNRARTIEMGLEARKLIDKKFNPERHYRQIISRYRELPF